mgnify:CR=1 FL=1
MVGFLKEKASLTRVASVLSLFTLVAYHRPFFRLVLDNLEGGFNGVMIAGGLVVVMLALNFLVYYLLLFLGRFVGKCLLAFTLIGNALSLYFINTYQVLITDKMMGNVFNTRYSEASGFFSWDAVWYLLFLGVVPCIYLFARRVDYGSRRRFLTRTGAALALSLAVALINMQNWPWIDRHAPKIGSLIMPWSYVVNSVRYYNSERKRNRKEIPLPDARIATDSRDVCVLVIGESARRANFSLYGYGRPTNPLLERDSVTALMADAAATYTTAGVKAILDHKPTNKLYEILPNYLYRNGVDVVWRSANWGEPPLHIDKHYGTRELKARYPEADDRYDGILLAGLRDEILSSDKDKLLIVLHTSTSPRADLLQEVSGRVRGVQARMYHRGDVESRPRGVDERLRQHHRLYGLSDPLGDRDPPRCAPAQLPDLRLRPRGVPRRGQPLHARGSHARRSEGADRDTVPRMDVGRGAEGGCREAGRPVPCLPQHPPFPRDRQPGLRRIAGHLQPHRKGVTSRGEAESPRPGATVSLPGAAVSYRGADGPATGLRGRAGI